MKGITPVIAVILLLLITISIVGIAFTFFQRTTETAAEASEEQLSQQLGQMSQSFRVEGVNGNEVYIRNLGTADLSGLTFYANDRLVDVISAPVIAAGSVGTITLDDTDLMGLPREAVLRVSDGSRTDSRDVDFYASHTLFYCSFDDTTDCEAQGSGTPLLAENVTFAAGHTGQGVFIGARTDLKYSSIQNFLSNSGTIELWLKTNWSTVTDNADHEFVFVAEDTGGFDFARGGDTLYYIIDNSAGNYTYVSYNWSWIKDRWYHVVITHDQPNQMLKLYIDGNLLNQSSMLWSAHAAPTSGEVHIGRYVPWWPAEANATIDELRILDVARG